MSSNESIRSTGIGSWPGEDIGQALRISFEECPDLPYFPELPARGPHAAMIGRGTAFLAGIGVDLQPAGWRMTDASSHDHRRAKSLLRIDLDQLEEVAQGYQGKIKYSVAGPWTLAAIMEKPRGDRVLSDYGARRDLAQSLAEGITALLGEMKRRLPDAEAVIQLDEPMLPSVLEGSVPTASGFSRHRAVTEQEASEAISGIGASLEQAGVPATVVAHCCAPNPPITLLHQAGLRGVAVDLDLIDVAHWDEIGQALEQGLWLGAGAYPTGANLTVDQVAARVLNPIRRLQLDPAITSQLVLTPACGLAGVSSSAAVGVLRTLRTAAKIVTESLVE